MCVCDNSIERPFLDSNVWRGLYRSGVNLGLIILEMRKANIINLRTSEKYYKTVNNFIHGTYIKCLHTQNYVNTEYKPVLELLYAGNRVWLGEKCVCRF